MNLPEASPSVAVVVVVCPVQGDKERLAAVFGGFDHGTPEAPVLLEEAGGLVPVGREH